MAIKAAHVALRSISRVHRIALAAQILLADSQIGGKRLRRILRALANGGAHTANRSTRRESSVVVHRRRPTASLPYTLSPRRRETLKHIARGLSETEISRRMMVTRHTVHEHIKAIYRATGVHSRRELMALLLIQGSECRTTGSAHGEQRFVD
jgi:DNA-binding NarL/FixJ family response regulator